ncbi:hypothetical protein EST38_g3185 [Candolleomyces aberdarensis]|uniref:Cell wall protein n=1 Tax=Candolleomyces aberdarensis TaxID=2316362 RepID=A0A4Q2DTP4_9AGAR|nr:hypothetical protein EST38_g3185 [Candolleomyces aberdarensis]
MKIPASSSLILATLAISSSSASLAAPTGDGTAEGSLSQIRGQAEHQHHANQTLENEDRADGGLVERDLEVDAQGMPAVLSILDGLPVLGGLLRPLLAAQCPDPSNPSSQGNNAPDPAEIQRLQDAVSTVSSVLAPMLPIGTHIPDLPGMPSHSGLPLPLSNDNSGADPSAPGADPSDAPPDANATPAPAVAAAAGEDASPASNGSFLISPTTTVANAEEASSTPSQDPTYLSGAADSGTPTSPGVPAGPPNTPIPVSSASA